MFFPVILSCYNYIFHLLAQRTLKLFALTLDNYFPFLNNAGFTHHNLTNHVLLDNVSVVQLVRESHYFHRTRRFIVVFRKKSHCALTWDSYIQSTPYHSLSKIHFNIILLCNSMPYVVSSLFRLKCLINFSSRHAYHSSRHYSLIWSP
jgi:hypothetical protein